MKGTKRQRKKGDKWRKNERSERVRQWYEIWRDDKYRKEIN